MEFVFPAAAVVVAVLALLLAWRHGMSSRATEKEVVEIAEDQTEIAEEALAETKRSSAAAAATAAADREADTRADVHPLYYRETVSASGDDERGLHVTNRGPAVATDVWAEYARTSDSDVTQADPRGQLRRDEVAFFRGGQIVARPPGLPGREGHVTARCHWTDGGGEQSTDWELCRRF